MGLSLCHFVNAIIVATKRVTIGRTSERTDRDESPFPCPSHIHALRTTCSIRFKKRFDALREKFADRTLPLQEELDVGE